MRQDQEASIYGYPGVLYNKHAELLGLKGIVVGNPEPLGSAWDEAPAADGQ